VTVCIAARSQGGLVLASDRMLTAGDIQFEPPTSKMTLLTSSIALMASGDSSFHVEVMTNVNRVMQDRIKAEPNNWWTVDDVVDLYVRFRNSAKRRRAEASILAPLGLDSQSFLASQNSLESQMVERITVDLINYEVPNVEVIVAGVDQDSQGVHPHIYSIYDGAIRCDDIVGFAAIGSGSRHAETQFMLAGHGWNAELPPTLMLTYSAKKNSESAPGVGRQTDMLVIGPNLGQSIFLAQPAMGKLDAEYRKAKVREQGAQKRANDEIKRYVEELGKEAAVPQDQPPKAESGEASTDGATGTA